MSVGRPVDRSSDIEFKNSIFLVFDPLALSLSLSLHLALFKVKVFLWLLIEDRLHTEEILHKKNWSGDLNCIFCNSDLESRDHVFLHCTFANLIWKKCLEFFDYPNLPNPMISYFLTRQGPIFRRNWNQPGTYWVLLFVGWFGKRETKGALRTQQETHLLVLLMLCSMFISGQVQQLRRERIRFLLLLIWFNFPPICQADGVILNQLDLESNSVWNDSNSQYAVCVRDWLPLWNW